jgi:catechol 2,3-dioxygenase-like lactoylglutathione lyase family enzyme
LNSFSSSDFLLPKDYNNGWKKLARGAQRGGPNYQYGERDMHAGKIIPILRIFDEAKAKEFYIGFLGFRLDWEHRFEPGLPLYMQVSRDACTLHLSEHHGDCCPGAALRIETERLEAYCRELHARQYRYARPGIEEMPWGSKDMRIVDPFGNRLIFTSIVTGAAE